MEVLTLTASASCEAPSAPMLLLSRLRLVMELYKKKLKLIDGIIKEPLGGAHYDRESAFLAVEEQITMAFDELKDLTKEDLVAKRMDKYSAMGVYKD